MMKSVVCVLALAMVVGVAVGNPNQCDITNTVRHAAQDGTIPVNPKDNVWFQNVTYYIDVNPDPLVTEYEFFLTFSYLQRQYEDFGECAYKYEHIEACGVNTWCATNWTSVALPPQMLVPGLNGPPDTPRAMYKVVPPPVPRYDKRGALQLSFESKALSSNNMITVANVPFYDVSAFTEIITNNVPKVQRSYELVFQPDPTTGAPKIKGHFDSKVVPISSLSSGEQSVFTAIDNGALQQIQDPLAPTQYLVPGHVYNGRSTRNTLNAAPVEAMRSTPWYLLSERLTQ